MNSNITEMNPIELSQEELEQAAGATFTPNTPRKGTYHAVGISTNYHILEKDEFRFMGKNITYEQANRIVEIADKVDAVLNTGYNGRDKIGRNEAAFLRAFNSQLKIEFGMTWDGSAGEDFDNSTGLPFNIPDPFAPGFPGLT